MKCCGTSRRQDEVSRNHLRGNLLQRLYSFSKGDSLASKPTGPEFAMSSDELATPCE